MSFLAKTSNIMDRDLYSSTFMTNYIEDDLNPARLAMINYFKWEKVATLFYNEDIFVSVSIFVKMIIKIIYVYLWKVENLHDFDIYANPSFRNIFIFASYFFDEMSTEIIGKQMYSSSQFDTSRGRKAAQR